MLDTQDPATTQSALLFSLAQTEPARLCYSTGAIHQLPFSSSSIVAMPMHHHAQAATRESVNDTTDFALPHVKPLRFCI